MNHRGIHMRPARPDLRDSVRCPNCGHADRTDKASSVVRQNSGFVLLGNSMTRTSYETRLGAELSPPPSPARVNWLGVARGVLFSLVLAGAAYGIGVLVPDLTNSSLPQAARLALGIALLGFGVVLPLAMLARAMWLFRVYPGKAASWRAARDRWNRLYYCSRDDTCFVAGESECCPPEDVAGLLYKVPPASVAERPDLVSVPV
jgi:hypothetical protein